MPRRPPDVRHSRHKLLSVPDDAQSLGGAAGNCFLDALKLVIRDVLFEENQIALVVDLQRRRCQGLADAEPGPLVQVDFNLNVLDLTSLPSGTKIPYVPA